MSEFSKWLDAEINDLARYKENNTMWGKHTEAVRIREMYRQCEKEQSTLDKEKITAVADKICQRFCRFPEVYDDKERMAKEHCKECPLNEVIR